MNDRTRIKIEILEGQKRQLRTLIKQQGEALETCAFDRATTIKDNLAQLHDAYDANEAKLIQARIEAQGQAERNTRDEKIILAEAADEPSHKKIAAHRVYALRLAMERTGITPINRVGTDTAIYEDWRINIEGQGELALTIEYSHKGRIRSGNLSFFAAAWAAPAIPTIPTDDDYREDCIDLGDQLGVDMADVVNNTTRRQHIREMRDALAAAVEFKRACDEVAPGTGLTVIERICQAHGVELTAVWMVNPMRFKTTPTEEYIEAALNAA